ncbi:MAG: phosphate transport system regulatory protein PhoU [Chloroflexota bacterium]|nr:MAG: phosphate transport system regulatory protein PhoU [Chloroflexota bacterium]
MQQRDFQAARRIDAFDAAINRLRYEIEEQSYTLLALQQPNAGDLRRIVAAVSIATNLERMGDHAAGIARITLRMENLTAAIHMPLFNDMARLAAENLNQAMIALEKNDAELARQIVRRDEEIDAYHRRVYDYLIKAMMENPATVEYATLLLWVSHDIERFADRVSNICERIVYTVTGVLFEPRSSSAF